ncbi:MAG: GntR family transcriptional regulator [Phycisphaerae bacterium]|nr:GntR family transcriptional regulator [Phycisphaerae bacterium]
MPHPSTGQPEQTGAYSRASADRSAASAPRHGKSAVKHDRIVGDLRQQILAGLLGPGDRLPTRNELIATYDVSSVTIQRAFDRLIDDGFVYSRGSRGTFVCQTPPHLNTYAMVFPTTTEQQSLVSRFWTAVKQSGETIAKARQGVTFRSYYTSGPESDRDVFTEDVRASRMAGLIMLYGAEELANTPVWQQPNMPRVLVAPLYDLHEPYASLRIEDGTLIVLRVDSLYERAVQYLTSRSRKRLAVMGMGLWRPTHSHMVDMARRAGLTVDPAHVLEFSPNLPQAAQTVTKLLLRQPADTRPDCIFIADDNLLSDVTAAIQAEGISTADNGDLDVLSHCNYPSLPPANVPVTYLGFDCGQVLQTCVNLIDARRAGNTATTDIINVTAVFESELHPTP